MLHDLERLQTLLQGLDGLKIENLTIDPESKEYSACSFRLNQKQIHFRTAHVTPTKVGQFVTFWKRIGSGPIMPFDFDDSFDFLIVNVKANEQAGYFVFSKEVLLKHNCISKNGMGGKRAMRVYPPWDLAGSKQALTTQKWQTVYFIAQAQLSTSIIENIFKNK